MLSSVFVYSGCLHDDSSVCDESRTVEFDVVQADIEGEWVPAPGASLGSVGLLLGRGGRPVEYLTGCDFCYQFGCGSPRDWPLELGATNEDRGGSFGSGEVKTLVSAMVWSDGYELEWGEPGITARMIVDVDDSEKIRFGFVVGDSAALEMHEFTRRSGSRDRDDLTATRTP